ncbi:MAG TPA: TIM-barrel domain-containing protein [Phycisphaerales bacterium]|nr:TIM-barrel domain-containing protein [Phycisphaerales bacterium]
MRRPVISSLAALAILLAAGTSATAQIVKERLAKNAVRFFESEDARQAALPSYALLDTVKPIAGEVAVKSAIGFSTQKDGTHKANIQIPEGTSLYGTGEVAGPLLRNGRKVVTWNTDAYGYTESYPSLYQSHPWVLAVRKDGTAFGVLADTTYRCTIDTGATRADQIIFHAEGPSFPVIVIEGQSPQEVVSTLAELTGPMPMPPKWAIGYHQCRYSYFPEARAREIAQNFRERKIPCDVIWYDIDYMDKFRVFSFNKEHFPDPKKLNDDLLRDGFHNVWMIDPGVHAEKESGVTQIYDTGTKQDVWVKNAKGETYKGEVWPGWCVFPDYTSPEVRQWWAGFYQDFMAQGITGVWNDMNEPAVFNVKSKTMPEDNRHRGDPAMLTPAGKPQGDKAAGDHARYHNVYGMLMVKGSREGIQAANPDKRPFVLSRANYIGGHRYAASWTGDNNADWPHLDMSIPMVLNLGLSGQPFSGPDIGGFNGNGDGQLFARWMGFGALFPFPRGHTAKESINKEPWAFGPKVEESCREAITRRYILMPYYYTVFRESHVTGLPVARPTFFADPKDAALRAEDDSFLIGGDVLVVAQTSKEGGKSPKMPAGSWREVLEPRSKDNPRLFVRPGAIVPIGPEIQYVDEKPLNPLTLLVNLDDKGRASGTLYEDAGDGYGFQKGEYLLTTYEATRNPDGSVEVQVVNTEGSRPRDKRAVMVRVLGDKELHGEGQDGTPVTAK